MTDKQDASNREEPYWVKRMRELKDQETIDFYSAQISSLGRKDLRVLDLGAGSGKVAATLSRHDAVNNIVAYDQSLAQMDFLEENEKIEKEAGGCHADLPFDDGQFDVIICRYAFHHFDRKDEAMKEMHRVLKNNCLLLISDPVMPERSRKELNPLYRIREDHYDSYVTYYEMICLLEDAGFIPMSIRPYHIASTMPSMDISSKINGLTGSLSYLEDKAPDLAANVEFHKALAHILSWKILRAVEMSDDKTKKELRFFTDEKTGELRFSYYMVDVAGIKQD